MRDLIQRIRDALTRMRDSLSRGHDFVTRGVWQIGKPGEQVPTGFIIKQVRVAILLGSKLLDGMHMIRASALAFATILSIVPFLAVTFYIIETFNLGEDLYALVQDRLETVVEEVSDVLTPGEQDAEPPETDTEAPADQPTDTEPPPEDFSLDAELDEATRERAPPEDADPTGENAISLDDVMAEADPIDPENKSAELQEEIVRQIFQGVTQDRDDMADPVAEIVAMVSKLSHDAATNTAALTLSGILLVFTTVFGLMRNIENTFNRIWGVRRTRSWYRMFSDYIVITLMLPFVAAVVLGVTAALQSDAIRDALGPLAFFLRFSQHLVIVLVFTLLYKLVPSTHVRLRYALLAGVVAGTLWVLLSLAYVQFQFGLAKYAAVLAAFAQFPMLLTWIYLSWAILLLGCEVAYAYQNESTFTLDRFAEEASYAYREAVGLRAMIEIGRRFTQGKPGLVIEDAARDWNTPMPLLRETLESLAQIGYLTECATEPPSDQPARPLDKILAGDIINTLREVGEEPSQFREDETYAPIYHELARHDNAFAGATIAELIDSLDANDLAPEPSDSAETPDPLQN